MKGKTVVQRRPTLAIRKGLPSLRFFNDVVAELKKVVWPTRQEATNLTFIVILVSLAVGLALGIIDMLFTFIMSDFILKGP